MIFAAHTLAWKPYKLHVELPCSVSGSKRRMVSRTIVAIKLVDSSKLLRMVPKYEFCSFPGKSKTKYVKGNYILPLFL